MQPEPVPGAIRVMAAAVEVRRLAEWLRTACAAGNVDETVTLDLELALVEAANNIVEHGYADGVGEIGLSLELSDSEAVVTLADRGSPAPSGLFSQCREVSLMATEGRGVGIVQSCVDNVAYDSADGLNLLRLTKRLA